MKRLFVKISSLVKSTMNMLGHCICLLYYLTSFYLNWKNPEKYKTLIVEQQGLLKTKDSWIN